MCDTIKKIIKFVGIIAAIAAAVAGVYYLVTKVLPCKNCGEDEAEDYVSCSCCDEEPVEVK